MSGFIEQYFIEPVRYGTGYNVVNTAVYAIILILAAFVTYRLLKRLKIKIDRRFLIGIIPFVAMGGIMRAWEDLMEATGATQGFANTLLNSFIVVDVGGVARNMLLISPVIYITMFFVALAALLVSKTVEKYAKFEYYKTWFIIGAAIDIIVLSQFAITVWFAFYAVIFFTVLWIFLLVAAQKISLKFRVAKLSKLLTNENTFLLNVHMFDATTTFVALNYFNYFEQHVVPSTVIGIFGPASMYMLKLIVVSIVLYYFDKELCKPEDLEKRTFLKIIVLILGMGPGLRNFLRMIMGV